VSKQESEISSRGGLQSKIDDTIAYHESLRRFFNIIDTLKNSPFAPNKDVFGNISQARVPLSLIKGLEGAGTKESIVANFLKLLKQTPLDPLASLPQKLENINLGSVSKEAQDAFNYYLNAINDWKEGSTGIRSYLAGERTMYNPEREAIVRAYTDLMNNTKYVSPKLLSRVSNLKEIPEESNLFYNPGLSFSANPRYASQSSFPKILLSPGAKTLPVSGIGTPFQSEMEHIVGGLFRVLEKTPRRAMIEQVNPNIVPLKW